MRGRIYFVRRSAVRDEHRGAAISWRNVGVIFEAILIQTPVAPVRLNPAVPAKLEEVISKTLEIWQVKGSSQSWGIASRDGKYLASPAATTSSNVWMAEGY